MNITVIAVGKLKEKFFEAAVNEYVKRLGRFSKVRIIELSDQKIADKATDGQVRQVLEKEGDDILSKISPPQYVIALCVEGKKMSSETFADTIQTLGINGKSDIVFVIGGSLGLDEKVKKRADLKLSFSDMTFPHQLMRVILLEQVYRAFKILANETYHK
ncbi:MAG: 23S rRNA (pseudouridine(1915)-N(3))-methyltransferase RlmH [Ruminococcaceae bacterium]|nr:23S rRNA (pseudouridine(1915)-N(3))-methyltransferase RlmH [Oscillospiraceae bacterium]